MGECRLGVRVSGVPGDHLQQHARRARAQTRGPMRACMRGYLLRHEGPLHLKAEDLVKSQALLIHCRRGQRQAAYADDGACVRHNMVDQQSPMALAPAASGD
eukprot:5327266-Prymnesium_polylepis.1